MQAAQADVGLGEALGRVKDDLLDIGKDELALAQIELSSSIKSAAIDAGAMILGWMVALIGLGLLCSAVVVALEPAISALWLRMLLMALVYLGAGAGLVVEFVRRMRANIPPTAPQARRELKRTAQVIEEKVGHE